MKKFLHVPLLLLALFLGSSAKAQTSVNLISVSDSSVTAFYCPLPVTINLITYGTAEGYDDATDNITLHVFWGDGTDDFFTVDLLDGAPMGLTYDYFYVTPPASPIHAYTTAGTYTPLVVATGPDGSSSTLAATPITVSSGCVVVDGYSYYDSNSNCTFDSGEPVLANTNLKVTDASGNILASSFSNASGYYSISLPTGMSGLTIEAFDYSGSFMSTVCPASGGYSFGTSGSSSFNFALDCITSNVDYYAGHSAYCGIGVPGSTGVLSFYAGINGCGTISSPATITVTIDPLLTYTGMIVGPAPTTIAGNVLTWNVVLSPYTGLTGFNISFGILTSTSAVVMDPACFEVEIDGPDTDINLANNGQNICLEIGGPYDPNNKEVLPAGMGAAGNVAPETEFTYTINFQNTGTAPAINVYVMDTISSNLDMSTFHIIATSHNMNPIFTGSNIVRFDYPGINLPDSNASEALSHGWVKYTIKAKPGLANGTQIKNTGHIYFDYNSAIVTNTTLNTIDISMGIHELAGVVMNNTLYPNPAATMATLQFESTVSGTLLLVDAMGKIVKQMQLNNSREVQLPLNEIQSGFYSLVIPGVQLRQNRLQVVK